MNFHCSKNIFTFISPLWLLIWYLACTANAIDRYPYILPKCCESNGNPSADELPKTPDRGSFGTCGSEGNVTLQLPKEFFPAIKTDSEHVEIMLVNSEKERECARKQDNLDISIDLTKNEASKPLVVGGKKSFAEVAFSGGNFLDSDGNIYSQHEFCVSSRTSNKTRLVVKTCKRQKCSREHLCISRCCGGRQSILNSPPTSHIKSLLDFCSTPTLEKKPWSPFTSNILKLDHRIDFYQMKYAPKIPGGQRKPGSQENCTLIRVKLEDERSFALMEDGSLQMKTKNSTEVLENFCIDGINGGAGDDSTGDDEETPGDEVVTIYDCSRLPVGGNSASFEESIGLIACTSLTLTFLNGLLL